MGERSASSSFPIAVGLNLMSDQDLCHLDEFVRLLTSRQRQLFVYVLSLVGDPAHANDIVQNVNQVMWSKRAEFTPGTNFTAWASRIAYWQVMDYCKRRRTDRHLFDSDLLTEVAASVEEVAATAESRLEYLDKCLSELPPRQRVMIRRRYEPNTTVDELARQEGRSVSALTQTLYRIRQRLMLCIEAKLAAAGEM